MTMHDMIALVGSADRAIRRAMLAALGLEEKK